jgi:N-methylhydantoinase B
MESAMTSAPALDPVTVGIVWDRLVSIVEESTAVQYRTAFSTVVQEANDFACSVMTPDGTTLASSGRGLPSFVHTQSVTLRHLLDRFDASDFDDGDVFITNDPWIATGHSMDLTLLRPVFYGGNLVAFAGSVAHAPDLGGIQHWNRSSDLFSEALLIPPTKLLAGGRENDTLLSLLRANSRTPDLTIGDLEAQLAATQVIHHRLTALMDEYRLSRLTDLAASILDRCERTMRDAIGRIADGTYVGEVTCDLPVPQDGHSSSDVGSVVIRAQVTVEDSDLTVSFEGSSPQLPGSFNSVEPFTAGYTLYALRLALAPLLPNNGGFYRPIRLICPTGTVVNARYPSGTISRHVLGHQVVDAVYAALSEPIPEAVWAQSGSAPCWDLILTGTDDSGRPFHRLVILNGGTGASMRHAGMTLGFPANLTNTPVEVMETLMPVLWECKSAIAGSGGRGYRHGGQGQRMGLRALRDMHFAVLAAHVENPARGLRGGEPGRTGKVYVNGSEVRPPTDGLLRRGDRLVLETPGGGGFGKPTERDAVDDGVASGSWADA